MTQTLNYPSHIIDMHTHMFNAYYLPLKGIFISWGIPEKIAHRLARLSYGITRMSIFTNLERAKIFKNTAEMIEFSRKDHNDPELVAKYAEALANDAVNLYRETLPWADEKVQLTSKSDAPWQASLNAELREIFEAIQEDHGDEESLKVLKMSPLQSRLLSDQSPGSDKSIAWWRIRGGR